MIEYVKHVALDAAINMAREAREKLDTMSTDPDFAPAGRDISIAVTKLDEAVMWAKRAEGKLVER